ncbi:hypothetical protein ACSSWA_11310 [Melioribacter sp. Ez-97]|uniref:hypothetical protein n=1 Tax=Melioribacter sp. Ez-97 TaxID=3423434 RepID=UPI003EDA5E56
MKIKSDLIKIFILLFLSIVAIYFVPALKTFFLVTTLILFYFDKPQNDYFWVFFVLLFVDNPGNLFWKETESIIKVGPIVFSFLQFFIIIAVLKIVIKKSHYNNIKVFYAKSSIPYLIWLIFLLIEGLILGIEGGGRTGYRYLYQFGLTFFIFPIFFVMPYMIKGMADLVKFFRIVSIFVVLNFISQVYNLIIGQSFHTLFGGTIPLGYDDSTTFENYERMLRPVYFVYSSFYAFILAPFYLYTKMNGFKRNYLYFIFVVSLLSVFITATRGWILAFFAYIIILTIIDTFITKKFTTPKIIFSLFVVMIIMVSTIPIAKQQFFASLERFETLKLLLQGDPTLGGTNIRLTSRLSPVLDKFKDRPITGWGFSKVGMEIHDGHVGNASLIMVGGIIGGIVVFIFLWNLIHKQLKLYKHLTLFNVYRYEILIISSSLIILLIIHSTSAQVFGFYRYVRDGGSGAYWIAIYLTILNVIYNSFKRKNQLINKV